MALAYGEKWESSADGKTCSCTVHGNAREPKQKTAPNQTAGPSKVLQEFGGLTASLTFLEDGLHAGMVTLRQNGFQRVIDGTTTLDEVLRITKGDFA